MTYRLKQSLPLTKKMWFVIAVLCLVSMIPLLCTELTADKYQTYKVFLGFKLDLSFYTTVWIVLGIASALFAGILACVDFYLRKELTITLFGLTLLGTGALDGYLLLTLNQSKLAENLILAHNNIYFVWAITNIFYAANLLSGTIFYLKLKSKHKRTLVQKQRAITKTTLLTILLFVCCISFIYYNKNYPLYSIFFMQAIKFNVVYIIPFCLLLIWTFLLLPKFKLRYYNIFSKLLVLSIAPLIIAQILMAISFKAFDIYFNTAFFLRFLSYLVLLGGTILHYVETFRNEEKMASALNAEIKQKRIITQDLLDREKLLARAEEISHIGSWELDIKSKKYRLSDEVYKIFGFPPSDLTPEEILNNELIVPEYRGKLKKEFLHALHKKTNFAVEYQVLLSSGERKYVLTQGYYAEKDDKLIGTMQDITELKKATLKLRKSEILLREAETVSHNGSWEWKVSDEYFFWSDEMYNIHGFLPHSIFITLESFKSLVHPDDYEVFQAAFERAITHKSSFKLDYKIIRPNGEIRFVTTVAKYKEDEIYGGFSYLGNTQDVTALKQTQRQLEEKIIQIDASNKELEQFAYVASHDLQEPLRKIRAFGDRLMTKYSSQLAEEGQDYIVRMQNAASRMQNLIDDLLTFSRTTKQEVQAFVKVNLAEVFKKVLTDLDYSIETANATIQLNVDQHIDGSPTQLAQLFQNIVSNSLKFSQPDIKPLIEIDAQLVNSSQTQYSEIHKNTVYCLITIRDNGIGFDQDYAEKIFDMFQRLHSRAEYQGTGMGLAICKKIIENHNGYIFAEGKEGLGAKFSILLPVNQYALP